MYAQYRRLPLSLAVASSLFLVACAEDTAPPPGPEMGNASPVASPAANPDGELIAIGSDITGIEAVGDVLAVRTPDTLLVGTLTDFEAGALEEISLAAECGDISANSANFVWACGQQAHVLPADNPGSAEVIELTAPATSATLADDTLVTADASKDVLHIYRDGELAETLRPDNPSDQLLSVRRNVEGSPESVVRINRSETMIQNIDLEEDRLGGALRIGLGVGQGAAGEGGLVLASDARASQLAVYAYDQVIMLHQTAPTEESPWGVAWDPVRNVAWVTSTGTNQAIAYDIADGVPLEVGRFETVPDAHNLRVLSDGTVVVGSATDGNLQIINPTLS